MKIKNTSVKIINIGDNTLLPDADMELPKSWENNPVIDTFCRMGFIRKTETVERSHTVTVNIPSNVEAPTESDAVESDPAGEPEEGTAAKRGRKKAN